MTTAGLILAAGSSRRMGSPKQLLLIEGRPMLELVVAQANASKLDEVLVVLGAVADEIRPRVDWDKGAAVRWIRERMGMPNALSVYIGDDRTDEDAFAAIKDGITIKVGEPTETAAGYYLPSPTEVERFLEWLATGERVGQCV